MIKLSTSILPSFSARHAGTGGRGLMMVPSLQLLLGGEGFIITIADVPIVTISIDNVPTIMETIMISALKFSASGVGCDLSSLEFKLSVLFDSKRWACFRNRWSEDDICGCCFSLKISRMRWEDGQIIPKWVSFYCFSLFDILWRVRRRSVMWEIWVLFFSEDNNGILKRNLIFSEVMKNSGDKQLH